LKKIAQFVQYNTTARGARDESTVDYVFTFLNASLWMKTQLKSIVNEKLVASTLKGNVAQQLQ
jgi:hypothetical protein